MRDTKFRILHDGGQSVLKGLHQLGSVLHAIRITARVAESGAGPDPDDALNHIAMLAGMGTEHVEQHADTVAGLIDSIDDLNSPVVDMTLSGLQAKSIQESLHALRQIIPDDQTDMLGAVNVVIRLARDLSMHLVLGGRHKLLIESLQEPDDDTAEAQ